MAKIQPRPDLIRDAAVRALDALRSAAAYGLDRLWDVAEHAPDILRRGAARTSRVPRAAAASSLLTGRRVAFAGGVVTLLMVLLFGLDTLLFWVTAHHGYLLIPSALGVPFLLPGLRFTPFADQGWTALGCEDFAALLLVGTVVRTLARHRRNHPSSGRLHRFMVGWGALMLGGAVSGVFRGLVIARTVDGGPLAYFGYPVLGAAFGALWCLLIGWIPGLAAVFAVLPTAAVDRAREWWVESGRLVLVYLVEPAAEQIRNWRGGGRAELVLRRLDRRLDLTHDENHRAPGNAAP